MVQLTQFTCLHFVSRLDDLSLCDELAEQYPDHLPLFVARLQFLDNSKVCCIYYLLLFMMASFTQLLESVSFFFLGGGGFHVN